MDAPKVPEDFKRNLDNLLKKAQSILITSHQNPDDDSIGSVLSTYYVLKDKYPNKNIVVQYSSPINNRWQTFKNFDLIQSNQEIAEIADNFNLIIFLDGSQYGRFSNQADKISQTTAKKVCIDHHSGHVDNFDLSWVNPTSSSTAELIYFIFAQELPSIPVELAEDLFLGIMGDTGFLTFIGPHQTYIYPIVARLVKEGSIQVDTFRARIRTFPARVFPLIQKLAKNTKIYSVKGWPDVIATFINSDFTSQDSYNYLEISEGVHVFGGDFSTSLTEAPWGFITYPEKDGIGVSMRSRPNSPNVRLILEGMGIGGGHNRAAGGTFKNFSGKLTSQKCLEQILFWMRKHKPEIV